tara:strand:+ start:6137 stop:7891 length:1755 start_codon:yes stop_codon:yes gene_type:complete
MAITRLQLPREMYATGDMVEMTESLEAGAPSIKYEGDKRPQTQMEGIEGQMAGPTWFFKRVENLEYLGYSPEEAAAIASNDEAYFEIVGDPLADGGQVRQKYGLGSIVKKAFKGVKNLTKNPVVRTALSFYPPTAPYMKAFMAAESLGQGDPIGAFTTYMNPNEQRAKGIEGISPVIKKQIEKEVIQRGKREAAEDIFGKIRDTLFYKKDKEGNIITADGKDQIDPLKIGLGGAAGLLGIAAMQKKANQAQPTISQVMGDRGGSIGLSDIQEKVRAAIATGDKDTYENLRITENLAFLPPYESIQKAEGGRIGYASGGPSTSIIEIMSVIETLPFDQKLRALEMLPPSVRAEVEERLGMAKGGRIGYSSGGKSSAEMLEIIQRLRAEGKTELEIQQILQQMFSVSSSGSLGVMNVPQRQSMLNEIIRPITEQTYIQQKPDDLRARMSPISSETLDTSVTMLPTKGRMQRSDMSAFFPTMENMQFPTRTMETNMPQIDATGAAQGGRINKAGGGIMNMGGMEMDLRGGGFVPMGKAEKADDVPARLSRNEFVMTADAVRSAGDGDIDRGADKMYATMKKLEDRVA